MTESSEQKTKRRYVDLLTNYTWSHQYSIFYDDYQQSTNLLRDIKTFKQRLRRRLPDQPFLTKVALLNRDKKLQAYLTMFTTAPAMDWKIEEVACASFSSAVNVIQQRVSVASLERAGQTILRERPHNLNRFFGLAKINRYAILNQHRLPVTERGI
jgi:hypothetical protein